MNLIDAFLNKITMYRLVVYELGILLAAAAVLSFFGVFNFTAAYLAYSVAFIFAVSWIFNRAFAYFFDAPYNPESTWITALILALIISPPQTLWDTHYLPLAFWASAIAIASKYIVAERNKHVYNPAAFGVAITALALGLSASWWVGTPAMLPFVLGGGLLIVRKIRRFDVWLSFMGVFTAGLLLITLMGHGNELLRTLYHPFLYTPIFFFATVMLTEPATMPGTRALRMLYGALTSILFLPNFHVGSFYLTPELALIAGNFFAYMVSPAGRHTLVLQNKVQLSRDAYEFIFKPVRQFSFAAGQYMEWTLPHVKPDSRGVRRYFTIASGPGQGDVRLGVRFSNPPSSFKQALLALEPGQPISVAQLAGDFVLPKDPAAKLVFMAGGIGITPFVSHLEHLLSWKEKRDIIVFYSNRTPQDAAYRELLARVQRELGIRTINVFTDPDAAPAGSLPALNAASIAQLVPDYQERTFYISGPQGMVTAFKNMLRAMGVSLTKIKTDYFPGF